MNLELKVPIRLDTNKFFGIDLVLIRSFWSTLLCVFGFVLTLFLIIWPKISGINEIRQQIDIAETQNKNIKQQIAYLSAVDQDKLRKNQGLIEQALPSTKDLYFIMNALGELGRRWNYSIDSFVVSPGKITGNDSKKTITTVTKVPLDLIMIGPRDKYLDLVKQIENSLPILSVDKFDVTYLDNNLASLKIIVGTYSNEQIEKVASSANWSDIQLSPKENELLGRLATFSTIQMDLAKQNEISGQIVGNRADPFNY